MNGQLQSICKDYIENRDILKKVFKLENTEMYAVCGAQICGHHRIIREEELASAKQLLKRETGIFSSFRGNGEMSVITALAVSEAPEEKWRQIQEMYQALKEEFFGSTYLAMAAVILPDIIGEKDAGRYIERGKRLYRQMKQEHPLLTSSEDSVLAILLAFSGKDDDTLIREMEEAYRTLKDNLRWASSQSIQTVSHILCLGNGKISLATERLMQLYQELERVGRKYGKDYQLSALAVLAISEMKIEDAVRDMLEVDEFLSEQKGYHGIFGIGKKDRFMHAAMLLSLSDEDNALSDSGILTSTLAMIAARQAMLCAIAASSAAASAAASS